MVRDELSVLSAFLTVAEERSFTRAAKQLGVSPSALSHAISGLEERLGVRSAGTDDAQRRADRGRRAVHHPDRDPRSPTCAAPGQVAGLRDRPAGRVRLVASRLAARWSSHRSSRSSRAISGRRAGLTTTDECRLDLVGAGFDAGIHLGEFIERDMVAVRVSEINARRSSEHRATSRRTRSRSRRAT